MQRESRGYKGCWAKLCVSRRWSLLGFMICGPSMGVWIKWQSANASNRLYSPQPLLLIFTVDRVEVSMVSGSLQVLDELVMDWPISMLGQWFVYEASTTLQ